jgi:hypothetical protein
MVRCTKGIGMDREQLMGLYFRLQRDLVEAYTAPPSSDGRIERLTDELAAIHRIIRGEMQRDEQAGDSTIRGGPVRRGRGEAAQPGAGLGATFCRTISR